MDLDFAENCYLRILESEPGHVQARHNLCVVWVEKGQLAAAETCLEEVLALAPQEDYIRKHLGIVRSKLAKTKDAKEMPYLHLAQCNTIIFNALSDTQCIMSRVYEKM